MFALARLRTGHLAIILLVAGLGVGLTAHLGAQTVVASPPAERSPSAQGHDAEFARLVKEWTTGPEFISPLVDHLPVAPGIPTPKDVLGYHVGAPQKLTRTSDIYRYYRALAAKSPRVKVTTIGKTDEGRDILIVYVGSEGNLRDLDRHRQSLGQLADPRRLTEQQALDVIAQTKPIYTLLGVSIARKPGRRRC